MNYLIEYYPLQFMKAVSKRTGHAEQGEEKLGKLKLELETVRLQKLNLEKECALKIHNLSEEVKRKELRIVVLVA